MRLSNALRATMLAIPLALAVGTVSAAGVNEMADRAPAGQDAELRLIGTSDEPGTTIERSREAAALAAASHSASPINSIVKGQPRTGSGDIKFRVWAKPTVGGFAARVGAGIPF